MIRLITHTDLDGSGCAIVAKHFFGKDNVYISHENYNTIQERTEEILETAQDYKYVFFTDICPEEPEVIKLSKLDNVTILDHHASREDMAGRYDILKLDTSQCGALLFYWHLITVFNFKEDKGLADFLKLVDTFDRWVTNDPQLKEKADDLCRIYNFYGTEWFETKRDYREFTLNSISDAEKHILDVLKHKEEVYFKKMMKKLKPFPIDGHMFAFSFATQNAPIFKDEVTKFGIYDGLIVPFVDGNSVSIYSKKGIDGSKYSSAAGGGGHPAASGFQIDFQSKIQDIVKEKLLKGGKY